MELDTRIPESPREVRTWCVSESVFQKVLVQYVPGAYPRAYSRKFELGSSET